PAPSFLFLMHPCPPRSSLFPYTTLFRSTVAPQLVASVRDVRRARRLRGVQATGPRAALQYVQPVLHDAMDRAIALAASMDSRGYAHTRGGASRGVNLALLVSLVRAGLGTSGLRDATV